MRGTRKQRAERARRDQRLGVFIVTSPRCTPEASAEHRDVRGDVAEADVQRASTPCSRLHSRFLRKVDVAGSLPRDRHFLQATENAATRSVAVATGASGTFAPQAGH